ncbi:hypothetical protein L596_019823 [Steinernema carpocapsae]|uniref:Uncharacterized protein n=1 Tax=Steinernema carpocapsae TaxID=34508 RepID=A0A4U5MSJ0_STECR|nr:hypothetical protein L596_019823 [Steinernema carpocapsae]
MDLRSILDRLGIPVPTVDGSLIDRGPIGYPGSNCGWILDRSWTDSKSGWIFDRSWTNWVSRFQLWMDLRSILDRF